MLRTHTIKFGPSLFQGVVCGYTEFDRAVNLHCDIAKKNGLRIVGSVRSFGVYHIKVEGTTNQINDLIKSLNSIFE